MTGEQYLAAIRTELVAAHRQHKMGENVLRAFGYIRRRRTVIEEINAALEKLGLVANPPIDSDMPLRRPRIVFSLRDTADAAIPIASNSADAVDLSSSNVLAQDEDDSDTDLPEPAFSVSELESADKKVEWVSPNASIYDAYSKMVLHKYSQLVVSSNCRTMQQAIKGIVSFQSMTKALMNGKPKIVGDCIDQDVRFVPSDADLKSVVSQLRGNDVVLVIGQDKRLRGIVTAWDLAEEFARLVDPFKRIGEIEERLRTLVRIRLGQQKVVKFLIDHGLPGKDPIEQIEELTMGELQRVLDFQEHWDAMNLPYGKKIFIDALNDAREFRNRLMHFKDPLNVDELTRLSNFCDMVREIRL